MGDSFALINDREAESLPLVTNLHLFEQGLVQEQSVCLMRPHDEPRLLLLGLVVAHVEFEGSLTLLVPAGLIVMVELGPWCYEDGYFTAFTSLDWELSISAALRLGARAYLLAVENGCPLRQCQPQLLR